jgi:hypothetical protein
MGVDINGWIEVRPGFRDQGRDLDWQPVIDLGHLRVWRHSDLLDALFGYGSLKNYRAIAPDRGLPFDVTAPVGAMFAEDDGFTPTWVTWQEITGPAWDLPSEDPETYVYEYHQTERGLVFFDEAQPGCGFEALEPDWVGGWSEDWPDGTEWTLDDGWPPHRAFRAERPRPRHIHVSGGWQRAWRVLAALAEVHGPAAVRLVVWRS